MTELEMKVEALRRCIPSDVYDKAIAELKNNTPPIADMEFDVEAAVNQALRDIGVPVSLIGHAYLVRAIILTTNDPSFRQNITSILYFEIAKAYNTTACRVERGMRHAIEVAWNRGDPDVHFQYFGNAISPARGKPTNREFITGMAAAVRQMKMAHDWRKK